MLQLDPVGQYAVIVAQMQTPSGAHAGKNFFCVHNSSSKNLEPEETL
jgi:hypothetical protein